jgi:hemolysin activation/secretion protein
MRLRVVSMWRDLAAPGAIVLAVVLALADVAAAQSPASSGPAASPQAAAPAGNERKFDLNELRIEGNTVLSEREIDDVVYPFLGPDRTAADVEAARRALEDYYEKTRGFATVSVVVPPQVPRDGVVVVDVIERPIARLRVTGAQWVTPSSIKAGAPSLAPGTIPNLNAVQGDILALNRLPDRTVTPSIQAGRAPDTVDVDLQVQDKLPLHGSLELDNRQSQDTTPLRLSGNLSYGNLWQRGDTATFGFQVAPQNTSDATVFTGSYLFHVPGSIVSLLANYIHSDSNVVTLGSTDVVGKGNILQLRALVPLGTTEDFSHSLSAGVDYKDVTENVGLAGQATDVPLTYYPFSVAYQAGWTGPNSTTDAIGTLVWAFRGLGSGAAAFDAKRFDANQNFVYVKADVSRTQELPYGLQAYGHLSAQVSPDPLVDNEQFSIGGLDTVRGYYEAESLGDYGGAGQLELRSPQLAGYLGRGTAVTSWRVHAFVDAGATAIRDPLPGQSPDATLASVGFGTRFRLYDHMSGSVEDAVTLRDGPVTRAGENRVLFSLSGDF